MVHVLFPVLALFAAAPESSSNWAGFLGAGAAPVESSAVPLTWSPSENVAWKATLTGYGQSSPIVWGERVYVTSVEGPNKETCRIAAFALKDGKALWSDSLTSTFPVKSSQYVSRAAPTPAADHNGLCVFFESGDLAAWSHDGKALWSRSLVKDHGELKSNHGLAASPVLTESTVIVLVDHGGPSFLAAFRKTDGGLVWKTERTSRQSWSSPALLRIGGKDQIVVSSSGSVDGYDPENGSRLWTYDKVSGNTSNTPRGFGENQILIGASVGRDGGAAPPVKSNLALRVVRREDRFEAEAVWTATEATSSFGSPVVHNGLAYFVNRSGVVYCLDAKTGEAKFTKRLKQSAWATPVGVGDRVYFFGKSGATTVLAAGPEFKTLAENELFTTDDSTGGEARPRRSGEEERGGPGEATGGPIQYGVAIVSGSILIRTGDRLYCLREKK